MRRTSDSSHGRVQCDLHARAGEDRGGVAHEPSRLCGSSAPLREMRFHDSFSQRRKGLAETPRDEIVMARPYGSIRPGAGVISVSQEGEAAIRGKSQRREEEKRATD
jgi:hypothetical protein